MYLLTIFAAMTSGLWYGLQILIGLIGGASIGLLVFCLVCAGKDLWTVAKRRKQTTTMMLTAL